ncbi:MAG: hypothetical protein JNM66_29600 [Bryobacterales bacterium]|nr:hypothetical protein [Bryobacterales bacterium]
MQYRVPVCHCRDSGKKVKGTAPGLAAAHALHHVVGVPQKETKRAMIGWLSGR